MGESPRPNAVSATRWDFVWCKYHGHDLRIVGRSVYDCTPGTLLFISQTQNQWQGAYTVIHLGFGMGIPLLLPVF